MKITITNKQKVLPLHRNCYRIGIEFMYGDADGDKTIELFIPRNEKNDAELPRFLQFLDNCREEYKCGRGGNSDYSHVKDYDRYVEGGELPPEDEPADFGFCWEYEPDGCGYQASYESYEITYFDNNNVEYLVDVSTKQTTKPPMKPKI